MQSEPEVVFDASSSLIRVVARGTVDADWFKNFVTDVAIMSRLFPSKPILVDIRDLHGFASVTERYEIGVEASEAMIRVPIAIVGREPIFDPKRFGELVARNRGASIRTFGQIAEAEQWLFDLIQSNKSTA